MRVHLSTWDDLGRVLTSNVRDGSTIESLESHDEVDFFGSRSLLRTRGNIAVRGPASDEAFEGGLIGVGLANAKSNLGERLVHTTDMFGDVEAEDSGSGITIDVLVKVRETISREII